MSEENLQLRIRKAVEWMKRNKTMLQKDIAERMGMSNVSFSRGLERLANKRDDKFILSFHNATDEVFNLDYLLGGDGPMLASQVPPQQPAPPSNIDPSSMVNAIIASHDQAIMSLKNEVSAKVQLIQTKDEQIADLRQQLSDKDEIIKLLRHRVADLEKTISERNQDDMSKYPFTMGASEDHRKPKKPQK